MKLMRLFSAVAVAVLVAACGTADPTAPAIDVLEPEVASSEGGPPATIGGPPAQGSMFCVKVVPESENAPGERLIIKVHRGDECPGGFTEPLDL